MKNSGHPDFLRVAIFVAAGSFAGAGALFLVLLVFTGRSADGPLTEILPNSAQTDHTRDLIRQAETLRNLVRSYDEQLESDRKLIERQQALIARLENTQQGNAETEPMPALAVTPLPEPATEPPPVKNASLPPVSAPPPPEAVPLPPLSTPPPPVPEASETAEVAEVAEATIPEISQPENPVALSRRPTWPRGLFDVLIGDGGAALHILPASASADTEPLELLPAGERFTVTRVLSREDGVWYELRYGWIRHSSRIERIEPGTAGSAASLLLPNQFKIQVYHGVNLYPVPSSKSIWNLKLLKDGEQHVVTSERQQEDGTWYELRYGWVKKTERIAELGKK